MHFSSAAIVVFHWENFCSKLIYIFEKHMHFWTLDRLSAPSTPVVKSKCIHKIHDRNCFWPKWINRMIPFDWWMKIPTWKRWKLKRNRKIEIEIDIWSGGNMCLRCMNIVGLSRRNWMTMRNSWRIWMMTAWFSFHSPITW